VIANTAPGRFRCLTCGGTVPPPTLGGVTCPACTAVYPLEDGILALSPPQRDADYPESLVELVSSVEGRHFWFAARNRVIVSTLERVVGPLSGIRVLDVGCGTGFVLSALESAGASACGIDMHQQALQRARSRVRGPLFRSGAASLPFMADFDIVSLFDVIEHVDDDAALLREASRVLAPGGCVAVTVPAGPHLWTRYDEVIGHKRRYDRASLTAAFAGADLRVREMSSFNCVPVLVQRLQRWSRRSQNRYQDPLEVVRQALRVPPAPVNALLGAALRCEAPFRRATWMRGGSLIAIGQPIRSHGG
jgi:SAM-dependent methyltransferase